MNAVTNVARQTPAQAAPTGTGGHAASSASKVDTTELVLDITQMGLDIVGIFDPTPISDGASGILSLARRVQEDGERVGGLDHEGRWHSRTQCQLDWQVVSA